MESDLKLIQECGFNSFEEVVKKVNELVDVMRVGRARAEKYLDRFTNEAKRLLKEGQKDKAKREILKKKNHAERVKTIDTQLNIILEKLREVKNSTQMLQVLKAAKYCNNLLLSELGQKDLLKENNESNESNENQDLIDNDKEITKYLETMTNFKKKKAKPVQAQQVQKEENFEQENNFPQPENNEIMNDNIPQDNNNNDMNNNFNQNLGNNMNTNNNFGVNQNNNQVNNINQGNNQNQINNPNNNFNNNFNNNNYTFNNYSQPKNPYDDIF